MKILDKLIGEYKRPDVQYKELDGLGIANYTHNNIKELVRDFETKYCRDYAGSAKSTGIIRNTIENAGGRCEYESWKMDDDEKMESGCILVHGNDDFTILLPIDTGRHRDNFTISHEIGHYVLHSKYGETPLIVKRYSRGVREKEANVFATCFLMPEDDFRSSYKGLNGNIRAIADLFDVSLTAAKIRVEQLGL